MAAVHDTTALDTGSLGVFSVCVSASRLCCGCPQGLGSLMMKKLAEDHSTNASTSVSIMHCEPATNAHIAVQFVHCFASFFFATRIN